MIGECELRRSASDISQAVARSALARTATVIGSVMLAGEDQRRGLVHGGRAAGRDDGGGVELLDDRRAADDLAGGQRGAVPDVGFAAAVEDEGAAAVGFGGRGGEGETQARHLP